MLRKYRPMIRTGSEVVVFRFHCVLGAREVGMIVGGRKILGETCSAPLVYVLWSEKHEITLEVFVERS